MASSDKQFLLTGAQTDALSKVFKFADVEETGYVDVATISTLAVQLLGAQLSENEKETINNKAESKAEKGLLSYQNFIEIMMETMQAMTHWGKLKTVLEGYVGFDTVQEQIRKKSLKRGFEFNLMVVGATGLGKSTMVNTLFKGRLSRISSTGATPCIPKTVEVKSVSHVIEEKGVRLKLTITDTPGFGDQINNESCWDPILQYINEQYNKYLKEETSINRKPRVPDSRVHCCLYFIAPTGHRLRPIDVEFMKRLDKCVNIVPVIAKADTLTVEEREAFRRRLREDIEKNRINIYPVLNRHDLDEEEARTTSRIRDQLPFAVIGSDRYVTVSGKPVLGRKTKWGLIEVENKNHCEFSQLRDMLIKTHMQDLKEVTDNIHYENYRRTHLTEEKHEQIVLENNVVNMDDVMGQESKI
ncbi:neuronal-specific septin-3-like [Pocillopora damicornis]|uniref:neuronal-specific septin-3-like n=1 Tax=Pocillopora damicornis TaxID=46731 RepID=UPI000F553329|nr:neuronal-specific septin-3-like [Pocillopora damicornis]XP_058958751.1 neuronal-specific septin-3-like isoform X1 [Pocillopora verrucosa]